MSEVVFTGYIMCRSWGGRPFLDRDKYRMVYKTPSEAWRGACGVRRLEDKQHQGLRDNGWYLRKVEVCLTDKGNYQQEEE